MQQKELHLHGYVIMPNHAHYILSVDEKINLSDVMRDFKRHTSKAITDLLKNEKRQGILREFYQMADFDDRGNIYKVLQEGFHPITIESEKFFLEKLAYIHENPVRKGFIEKPEYWKYSSAKNYINEDHSIIRVECL
jgi:REP element-mobilizing transposase RayT